MNGRILVIDDSEIILARVRRALEAAGYEVVTTSQTIGAARHIRNCDLCVIDFHMPGFDGAEVVKSLRAAAIAQANAGSDAEGGGPPKPCGFYVFTSDDAIARDYARYGFDGAFTEKGDDEVLIRQVKAALRRQQLQAVARRLKPGP